MDSKLYQKYSTVIVMLWMERFITDAECRRIMERLNEKYLKEKPEEENEDE